MFVVATTAVGLDSEFPPVKSSCLAGVFPGKPDSSVTSSFFGGNSPPPPPPPPPPSLISKFSNLPTQNFLFYLPPKKETIDTDQLKATHRENPDPYPPTGKESEPIRRRLIKLRTLNLIRGDKLLRERWERIRVLADGDEEEGEASREGYFRFCSSSSSTQHLSSSLFLTCF